MGCLDIADSKASFIKTLEVGRAENLQGKAVSIDFRVYYGWSPLIRSLILVEFIRKLNYRGGLAFKFFFFLLNAKLFWEKIMLLIIMNISTYQKKKK